MTVYGGDSSAAQAQCRIDVWCCFHAALQEPALLAEYADLLSAAERAQRERFRFERDRQRYLVTRAMVRTVLSRYAPVAPRDWCFEIGPYGRPAVATSHALPQLAFNLSHSNNLIVLAVAHGRELGVDTENLAAREAPLEVAERYFAPAEAAALRVQPPAHRQQRFFEYWTLKESYIKARQMGLSLPLDGFYFAFEGSDIDFQVHADPDDRAERWRFWQLLVAPHDLIGLCAECRADEAPTLHLRSIVPGRGEQGIDYTLLRSSRAGVAASADE